MAIEAIISKLNSEALGKAVAKSDQAASSAGKPSPFQEMLSRMESGAEFAQMLGVSDRPDGVPAGQMQALGGEQVAYSPSENATGIGQPAATERVVDMLGEVNKGQLQMDSLVNHVLYSGRRFSNQELLVIQAHVFHFAQMTELTVKVAEQGISSVKAVLNTQVQ